MNTIPPDVLWTALLAWAGWVTLQIAGIKTSLALIKTALGIKPTKKRKHELTVEIPPNAGRPLAAHHRPGVRDGA
jgi:hypothetical protein